MRPTDSNGGRLDDAPDLVAGLCGVAIYALARRERALAAAVVARLRACSMADGDGVIWAPPGGPIDLGTAHGLAGLVAMELATHHGSPPPALTELTWPTGCSSPSQPTTTRSTSASRLPPLAARRVGGGGGSLQP